VLNYLKSRANIVQRINSKFRKRSNRVAKAGAGFVENGGNVLEPRDDLVALSFAKWWGDGKQVVNRGDGLLDLKSGITLPAPVQIQFPADARQR